MALESLQTQSGNLPSAGSMTQADTTTPTPITPGLEEWYKTNLGREADPEGLTGWSKAFGETLDPNEITQLQQSPEYQNRQFLTNLYQTELGRAPDVTGMQDWMKQLSGGMSREDLTKAFTAAPEAAIYGSYKRELGREPTAEEKNLWFSQNLTPEQISQNIAGLPEATVYDLYQQYLGRAPDTEGLKSWSEQLLSGRPSQQIAADIALSPEARGLRAGELSGFFTKQFGEDFVNALTADEMNKFTDIYADIMAKPKLTESTFDVEAYLKTYPEVANPAVWVKTPWEHYLEATTSHGWNPVAKVKPLITPEQRYQEVLKQAALDPELGEIMKKKDRMLYESLTPIEDPNVAKSKDYRSSGTFKEMPNTGQYGSIQVDGIDLPILNAKVVNIAPGEKIQDFSHWRNADITHNIGWNLGAFSSTIARGAAALGVTKNVDPEGGLPSYTGLDQAARLLNIDPSKFQDKQIQEVTKDQYDENGILIQKGGQPAFQVDEMTGQQIPVMKTVSAQDQLYDAVNEASKDIYSVTGPNLQYTHAQHNEGDPNAFQSVLYKRGGDKLLPISAPQTHGGVFNMDVYTGGSGFNFGRDIAPGLIFVGGAALAWTGAGAALAGSIGNVLTGAAATAVPTTTATVVGGIAVGAATGAVTAALTGGDVGRGALQGGVLGGVSAGMPTVLKNVPGMDSLVGSIANTTGLDPKQVSGVISSTLARTLSTAAAGANGDQILKSFSTALASSSIGAGSAKGVESLFKGTFSDEQLAGMARATQLVTNAAATSLISGGSTEQVAGSVINSLVTGAGSIKDAAVKAGTQPPKTLTKAELDAWMEGQSQVQTGPAPYYETAGTTSPLVKRYEKDTVEVTNPPPEIQGVGISEKPPLDPETEAQFKELAIKEDAILAAEKANKTSEIVTKLDKTDVSDEYILDALKLYDISQAAGKIALDMSKAGASQKQIAAALSKGTGTTTGGTTTGGTTTGGTTTGGTTTGGTTTGGGGGGTGEGGGGEGTDTDLFGPDIDTGGTKPTTPTTPTTPRTPTTPTVPRIPTIPKILANRQVAAEDDQYIKNLIAGLTGKMDYTLSGLPIAKSQMSEIPKFATGSSTTQTEAAYNPFSADISGIKSSLTPNLTKARLDYILTGLPGNLIGKAEGGSIQEHNPKFFSEGGLGSIQNRYVTGDGDGTSDSIPAMLANGEFVIPADVVSSLGNGSNDAGAKILDEFLRTIRKHKRAADAKQLPPDSKGPLGYLLDAKRKVKA